MDISRYRLDVRDKAKEQIKFVWPERLRAEIVDLRDEPRPPNSELQRELQQRYRLKIDGWRVFYKIDDQDKGVTVLEVRPRNRNPVMDTACAYEDTHKARRKT